MGPSRYARVGEPALWLRYSPHSSEAFAE